MTTVAKRVIRSSPQRDTISTWETIVDLLTAGKEGSTRRELLSISGIASSVIAEQAPKDSAIVVTCDGPRTRLYCLYDEDAIGGTDAEENALGYDPLRGDWALSLPCPKEDLAWVSRALLVKSKRITARDLSLTLGEAQQSTKTREFTVDMEAFLKS